MIKLDCFSLERNREPRFSLIVNFLYFDFGVRVSHCKLWNSAKQILQGKKFHPKCHFLKGNALNYLLCTATIIIIIVIFTFREKY